MTAPQEPTTPLTDADLKTMNHTQIDAAFRAGRLDHLLGVTAWKDHGGMITAEDLDRMKPAQVVAAMQAGRIPDVTPSRA